MRPRFVRITTPLLGSALFVCMTLGLSANAHAGLVNDLPSCYAYAHIRPPAIPYDKLLYILVDQTVQLTPRLEQSVVNNALRLIQPGSKFVVADFSAFAQGRYLQVVHTGIVERPLSPSRVDTTPIRSTRLLKRCLRYQMNYARDMVAMSLVKIFKGSSSSFAHSDIMMTLKVISKAIAEDPVRQKVLFLVSDGLENSSVTSFYADDTVRVIDPSAEMAKAAAAHLFGNFGGASVYVLGGVMIPPLGQGTRAQREGYHDPQVLISIHTFWREYFAKSHACLIEFGEPALTRPMSYRNPKCNP